MTTKAPQIRYLVTRWRVMLAAAVVAAVLVSLASAMPALATHNNKHGSGGAGGAICSFQATNGTAANYIDFNKIFICDKKWYARDDGALGNGVDLTGTTVVQLTASTTVTIASGTTVTWVNKENTPHNVEVEYDGACPGGQTCLSPMLQNGVSFTHTFATGAEEFYCDRHANSMAHVPVTVN